MELKYSVKTDSQDVKAMGRDLNVSFKDLVIVSDAVRGKKLQKAINILEQVANLKRPIPYKKYQTGVGHRKGSQVKIGKYPEKAAKHALDVLRNLESNAQFKGLDTDKLKITHIQALKGVARLRRKPKGRWTVWNTQYCHLQAVAKELK